MSGDPSLVKPHFELSSYCCRAFPHEMSYYIYHNEIDITKTTITSLEIFESELSTAISYRRCVVQSINFYLSVISILLDTIPTGGSEIRQLVNIATEIIITWISMSCLNTSETTAVLLQYLELCHGELTFLVLAISGRGILSSDDVAGHVAHTIFFSSYPIP